MKYLNETGVVAVAAVVVAAVVAAAVAAAASSRVYDGVHSINLIEAVEDTFCLCHWQAHEAMHRTSH